MKRTRHSEISIVVACHNAAATVAQTVASVRQQTYHDWELICIDDGSSDDTAAVLDALAADEPRLRWYSTTHGGQPVAKNRGAAAATGRYLLFLDADDVLRPDALHTLISAARRAGPYTLIAGGWELLDRRGHPLGVLRFPTVRQFTLDGFLSGNRISIVTLIPRHLAGSRPFDETLEACIDWDLWLRLAYRGARCRTIPRVVFGYRLHSGSLSRRCGVVYASGRRVIERWLPLAHDRVAAWSALGRWAVAQAAFALAAGNTAVCDRCTHDLRTLPLPRQIAQEAAGALHYAFQFVRGSVGETWRHATEPWLAECADWLDRSPLAPLAETVLADLRGLIAAADPLERLAGVLDRRCGGRDVSRIVVYGLGNNGIGLCERLRGVADRMGVRLGVADDFADDLTFSLLGLPRVDPHHWKSWPVGTFVIITPNCFEPMAETLRAAGGRSGEDFATLVDSCPAAVTPAIPEVMV